MWVWGGFPTDVNFGLRKSFRKGTYTKVGNCTAQSLLVVFNTYILNTKFGCKIQGETKKRELLKNPTKIEEIDEKTFIDRN